MDLFSRTEWHRLAEVDAFPCVSIYMPLERAGRDVRQNSIRFRNLLDDAAEQMHDHHVAATEIQTILAPARGLLQNSDFWQHRSDGLTAFVGRDLFHAFRVPLAFDELVIVNHRFHLKPLLRLLQGDGRFYVLAVSAKGVRLFEGTHYTIRRIEPIGLPEDLVSESNPFVAMQETPEQPRPALAGLAGEAIFHGEGAMGDSQQMHGELQNYFARISRGLQKYFTIERAPLVFAGSEKLFPYFRSASHYPRILDTPITAGADNLDERQLHTQAWKLVAPLFEQERRERLDRFGMKLGTGLASSQLELVLMAARQGAIDALFVPRGLQCWGCVDEQSGEICVHEERQAGDDDLLDDAATHTLLNSGLVYTLEPDEMPMHSHIAAIFRYPVSPTIHTNRM